MPRTQAWNYSPTHSHPRQGRKPPLPLTLREQVRFFAFIRMKCGHKTRFSLLQAKIKRIRALNYKQAKIHHTTRNKSPEWGQKYSSTLSLTSTLEMGGCTTSRPGFFTPVEILTVQEAGWAPGQVLTNARNLAPTGIRSPNRPTRSETLYRLRCPDSPLITKPPRSAIL